MVQPLEKPKGKPGRPTREETLAKGVVKTEMDPALRLMKRHFVPALENMIRIASDNALPLDKQFRLWQDIVNMYVALVKVDKVLGDAIRAKMDDAEIPVDDIKPTGVVFQLHG